jgi:hypothetical protein
MKEKIEVTQITCDVCGLLIKKPPQSSQCARGWHVTFNIQNRAAIAHLCEEHGDQFKNVQSIFVTVHKLFGVLVETDVRRLYRKDWI